MKLKTLTAALFMACSVSGIASADQSTAPGQQKKAEMAKLGGPLSAVAANAREKANGKALGRIEVSEGQAIELAPVSDDGFAAIDAVASGDAKALAAVLESLGARNIQTQGKTVSAQVPATQLEQLASSPALAFATPVMATTNKNKEVYNFGLVQGQADRSMRTDEVREKWKLDGEGLTIGVLSDSFSCVPNPATTTADDIANGDLPPNVTILSDIASGCIDEGRGMAQLIHDVLPKANIAFWSAFNGQADFATGIVELAKAGSDVIVDDIIYFAEPMFQDGIIAQAADEVSRLGVPYYSSNGNRARDAFQLPYEAVDDGGVIRHDWDPGPAVDTLNRFTATSLQTTISFNWDSPNFSVSGAPGSPNDVEIVAYKTTGERLPDCFPGGGPLVVPADGLCQFGSGAAAGVGADAIDVYSVVTFFGPAQVDLAIETAAGEAPGLVKGVFFRGATGPAEYPLNGAPSGFGHNNAAGAEGVGASGFFYTEEFIGDPQTLQLRANAGLTECVPACLNDFSSAGGTPIVFDTAGNRLASPEVRLKPGLTGPDGTNTTFFGGDTIRDDDDGDGVFQTGEPGEFPNFFGTSAAAPHAASVAAMLIEGENTQIRKKLGQQILFRMCQPGEGGTRADGATLNVSADGVSDAIDGGALLGPCDRSEPSEIYGVMRATAQDMSERASLSIANPVTIQVFDEVGPDGFDFDSGFGFIDAFEAVGAFLEENE